MFVVLDFDFRGWGVTCEIVLEDQDGTTGNRIYNLYVYIKKLKPLKFLQFFMAAQYLNKLSFYLNKIFFV